MLQLFDLNGLFRRVMIYHLWKGAGIKMAQKHIKCVDIENEEVEEVI